MKDHLGPYIILIPIKRWKMSVFVTGDKHGEIEMYRLYKKRRPFHPVVGDKLIIAGDFGLLWRETPDRKEDHFRRFLEGAKWETLFVDGNHENHELLATLPVEERWGGKVGRMGEKIFHLKRGEIYNIDGHKILTFGGARSTDMVNRVQGVDWWPEEIPTYAEMEHCLDSIHKHGGEVDYVITHTCPQEVADWLCRVYGHPRGKDRDPLGSMLSHISSVLTFKDWYFGHWHLNLDYGKYHCLWHRWVTL